MVSEYDYKPAICRSRNPKPLQTTFSESKIFKLKVEIYFLLDDKSQ